MSVCKTATHEADDTQVVIGVTLLAVIGLVAISFVGLIMSHLGWYGGMAGVIWGGVQGDPVSAALGGVGMAAAVLGVVATGGAGGVLAAAAFA